MLKLMTPEQTSEMPEKPKPTETTPYPDETVYAEQSRSANWKTYDGNNVSFKYPSSWKTEPLQLSGSGYVQEIKDENGIYTFTVMLRGNYSNGTGKPFKDL